MRDKVAFLLVFVFVVHMSYSTPVSAQQCAALDYGDNCNGALGSVVTLVNRTNGKIDAEVQKSCQTGTETTNTDITQSLIEGGKAVVGCTFYDTFPYDTICKYSINSCSKGKSSKTNDRSIERSQSGRKRDPHHIFTEYLHISDCEGAIAFVDATSEINLSMALSRAIYFQSDCAFKALKERGALSESALRAGSSFRELGLSGFSNSIGRTLGMMQIIDGRSNLPFNSVHDKRGTFYDWTNTARNAVEMSGDLNSTSFLAAANCHQVDLTLALEYLLSQSPNLNYRHWKTSQTILELIQKNCPKVLS